jgi:hypothetical protein
VTVPPAATLIPNKPIVQISRFSDAALQAQVDKVLAGLPADKVGAAVLHGDLTGVSLTVVAKVGDHWSIDAAASRTWSGSLKAEAEVTYSW